MSEIIAKPIMKAVDELKREVTFIVYEPMAVDTHGEYATANTLSKACDSFNKAYFQDGVAVPNLFHSKGDDGKIERTDSFEIVKSFIVEVDSVVGEEEIVEGTWLAVVKFNNDVLWQMFLDGDVSGLSMGAIGRVEA